jgi:hypothetical protein
VGGVVPVGVVVGSDVLVGVGLVSGGGVLVVEHAAREATRAKALLRITPRD